MTSLSICNTPSFDHHNQSLSMIDVPENSHYSNTSSFDPCLSMFPLPLEDEDMKVSLHPNRTDDKDYSVRFAANPVSRVAFCVDTEDATQCWYTLDDLMSFKIERKSIVYALRQSGGKIPETAKICTRGFEDYVSQETAIAKRQNIKHAVKAVLMEQDRQRSEGRRDETMLALISHEATYASARRAEQFGLCDAQEAFRLYAEYIQMIKSENNYNSVARTA
jgi:hypothetical protein